jgi:UDP-N-acetylglucosamine diphosphorylase / glucose-1-phosphate thymidylyltransferase / UDP-N-acetylgalactosamine diphosphorylase / glucosamine-1-phosphate N-acetyltransferase / galactosamine-1-phosphate N-acetyltransferase
MNIVIPMAGEGTRFPRDTYKVPKPLIEIYGIPMIQRAIESLGLTGNYHFVIRKDSYYDQVCSLLHKIISSVKIISVEETTRGPASSCLLFKDFINSEEELIIANCDQIMWWDPELFLMTSRYYKYDGVVVTYTTTTPKNSYAKLDSKGFVQVIKEKEVISDISLNGIHYWRKGKYFVKSAEDMIQCNDTASNGEFYVGPTYNYMIKNGLKVGIHHIPNYQHNPVGVPEDLNSYLSKL